MKTLFKTVVFVVISLSMLSCDQLESAFQDIQGSIEATKNPVGKPKMSTGSSSEPEEIFSNLYEDEALLKQIEADLKDFQAIQGEKLMVYNGIHFYNWRSGRVLIKIQDPENKENADEYEWTRDKGWQYEKPVKPMTGSVSDAIFPLDSLSFATVAKVQQQIKQEAAQLEGAEMPSLISFMILYDNSVRWQASVSGARKDLHLHFNLDGSLREK